MLLLWQGTVRFLYPLFSLPTPNFNMLGSGKANFDVPIFLEQKKTYKILLLGFPDSGTSAIFKQVGIICVMVVSLVEMVNEWSTFLHFDPRVSLVQMVSKCVTVSTLFLEAS